MFAVVWKNSSAACTGATTSKSTFHGGDVLESRRSDPAVPLETSTVNWSSSTLYVAMRWDLTTDVTCSAVPVLVNPMVLLTTQSGVVVLVMVVEVVVVVRVDDVQLLVIV
jgi:hypothetical protein